MIEFEVDGSSGVATYLQLAQQVRRALRLRLLRPGDRLPTAREVVGKLAINPNTVLKAYRELEREGLVGARPGQGTFVLATLAVADPEAQQRLRGELDRWLALALSAGLGREDTDALYEAAARDCFAATGTAGVA